MMTRLTDAERIYEIAKRLLAEQRKFDRMQSKDTKDYTPKQRTKHTNDLNYQAHEIVKIETQLHAAAVDAGLADLREPQHYAEKVWRPTGFHSYQWQPARPASLRVTEAA